MEIHQLEYFLAVEKYRNFSTAALEIDVSQSTLSQQIKKLEEELGVKLFIRYPRSVSLTNAGEEFLAHARRIVSEIQSSRETMQKYTSFVKGNIKIGVSPNMAHSTVGKLIPNFARSYPGFDLQIHVASTDELLKGLREKKVNVAFICSPYLGEFDIDFHPLAGDQLVMMAPAGHPLAARPNIGLADLAQEKLIIIESNAWLRNALSQACHAAGFEPKILLHTMYLETSRTMVEEGMAVALVGNRLAQWITKDNTAVVPIRESLEWQYGLALPRYSQLPLATIAFRDFILTGR